ncbi:MAG TPA: hypothetical protein VJM32_03190 [Candidatus Saccharimonadales bacterium]|nr:hypothetical protein [Candidatus Saccharimonadales bacterium]
MVMAEVYSMTKVAAWDELVRSDLVIHGGNLQIKTTYAYVRRSEFGGIRPPAIHAGVRVLAGPAPYEAAQGIRKGMRPGEQVVLVRFRAVKRGWTLPVLQSAFSLGLVPDEERDPLRLSCVCIPHYRLGMLLYERLAA